MGTACVIRECSANTSHFGLQIIYGAIGTGQVAPWIALAFGYEFLMLAGGQTIDAGNWGEQSYRSDAIEVETKVGGLTRGGSRRAAHRFSPTTTY